MGRRLFNFLTLVSVLLCAVTVWMWVRGYRVSDELIRPVQDTRGKLAGYWAVQSWRGSIYFQRGVLDGGEFITVRYRGRRIVSSETIRMTRQPVSAGVVQAERRLIAELRQPDAPFDVHELPRDWMLGSEPAGALVPPDIPSKRRFGFGYERGAYLGVVRERFTQTETRSGTLKTVAVPIYAIAILCAVLPGIWGLAVSRRSWKRVGVCRRCSYNLTGNTSGVCPECGTRIGEAQPAEFFEGAGDGVLWTLKRRR